MESINMFGGMNSDLSSFIQNTEKYLKALNVRPVTDLGESNGALTNVRGNNCEIQFPTLRAVYRFAITTTAATPVTNSNVTITINAITSAQFTISSFASITDVVNAIKGMSNCYNNPSAISPTFAIAYDDDYFTIYQNPSHTLCSNADGISPTITVTQSAGSANRFFISYVNSSDAKIAMTATGANTPLTFISEVTFNPLAIIGSTHIEGTFYLFTVPTANTILKIGQIWSLTYSPVSTNDSAFTTKLKLLYNNYLNFSIDYPIAPTAVIGRYELPSIQRIYWSDFNNYVRACNVVDENLMVVDPKTINIIPQTILTVPTLKKITSGDVVNNLDNLSSYQCAYKYFKSNGGQTNFSIPSNIVTVTNGGLANSNINYFMGTSPKYCSLNGEPEININKTITWEVNEVDNNYDTIKFYIIINNSGTFKIYSYDEQVIGDVLSIQTTFRNDTALMTEIPLSEFLIENNSFTSAKTIEQKDNRLFFGNVKNAFESLVSNFDARTYRYALSSLDASYKRYEADTTLVTGTIPDYSLIDKQADIIPSYNLGMGVNDNDPAIPGIAYNTYKDYKYQKNSTKIGGTGPFISYEFGNELFASDVTTTFPTYNDQALTGTDQDLESSNQSYKYGYRKAGTKNDTSCSFNPFFKNISPNNLEFDQKYYTGNVDGQGGAKNTIGHDYLSGNFRTYERNEIYRFAIVFKSKSGYSSFAKFIGDIKFPDYGDPCPVENRAKVAGANSTCEDFRRMWLEPANNFGINPETAYSVVPYIKFNVNISKELADLISGYEIVRVQRRDQDKTIATTGIVNQISQISGGANGYLRMGTKKTPSFFRAPWLSLNDPLSGTADGEANPAVLAYHPFENLCNGNNNLITPGDRLIPSEGYNQGYVGRTNPSDTEFSAGDVDYNSYWVKKFYVRSQPLYAKMNPNTPGNQFIIFNSEYVTTGGTSTITYGTSPKPYQNFNFHVDKSGVIYPDQISSNGSPAIFIILNDGNNANPATPIDFQSFNNSGIFHAADSCNYEQKSKLFVSHFKPGNLKPQYGGRTYIARSLNEYISTGALRKVDDLNFDTNVSNVKTYSIKAFGGDTFFGILDIQKSLKRWTDQGGCCEEVGDNVPYKFSQTWFLPYTSTYNLDLRHGYHVNYYLNNDSDIAAAGSDEYKYNTTYSNENNLKTYFAEPFIFNETTVFKNRIYWSSVKINGFTSDQWTNIPTNNFYDVDGNYGGINALITLGQNMFFLQNNAFGRLLINPVSVMTDANSSQLRLTNILGDSSTLDKHFYYSVNIGTQHQWSVAKSGSAITFCDINTNKLYLFNGESLDPISDSKGHRGFMNKVLHNRIRITDNPIKYNGILSTYDFKNNEFLYTFLNKGYVLSGGEPVLSDEKYTLAYSDLIQQFSSFYSFTPYIYINNNSIFYSPENYTVGSSVRAKAYLHNEGLYGSFYGTVYPSEVKVLVNANPSVTKAFDNLSWQTQSTKINYTYYDEINNAFASITGYDSDNVIYPTDTYSKIRVYNQSQNTDWITTSLTPITGNLRKLEKSFNMQAPRNKYNNNGSSIFDPAALTISSFGDRLRDKFITVDLSYPNSLNNRFIMHNLKTSYRVSDR